VSPDNYGSTIAIHRDAKTVKHDKRVAVTILGYDEAAWM
jgi:hypothetical protein